METFVLALTDAINGRRLGSPISDRTVWRYLESGAPLSRRGAADLIAGCNELRLPLPEELVAEIFESPGPLLIVYPGHAKLLAEDLLADVRRELKAPADVAKRIRKRFIDRLSTYENFSALPLGRTIWFWIRSYFGPGKWRQRFNQLRMRVDVSNDGKAFAIPDSLVEAQAGPWLEAFAKSDAGSRYAIDDMRAAIREFASIRLDTSEIQRAVVYSANLAAARNISFAEAATMMVQAADGDRAK